MNTIFEQTSFEDFMGKTHQCVIGGVIIPYKEGEASIDLVVPTSEIVYDDYGNVVYDEKNMPVTQEYAESLAPAYKIISIGISICNPEDTFELWKGQKQAEGRALKRMDRLVAFSKGGMCTEDTVAYFVHQTAENLSKNPGLFIKGYNERLKKFLNA